MDLQDSEPPATAPLHDPGSPWSAWQVLVAFLKLGVTSFGGPVAHLGYFRTEFVERRRWLDDRAYSELVALCQFLPGPASSQVGMAIGLGRAGWWGALAAWAGFTLPSALALMLFAYGVAEYRGLAESGWVHGLKVVAVAVVAQAVWGMGRTLCPDRARAGVAVLAAALALALPPPLGQLAAIGMAALIGRFGLRLPRQPVGAPLGHRIARRTGAAALACLAVLLAGLPAAALLTGSSTMSLLDGVFRSGALVFGGGHVVLPLLQAAVVPGGAVSSADFVAGYGAAQAVPGPLFTFAAYLGTVATGPLNGWVGGLAFLVAIFLPAFLLLVGALPFWDGWRRRPSVQATMAGANAGVVGILAAALYDPVWTSAIRAWPDAALALAAFALLVVARVSPVWVVLLAAVCGWALSAG
ncbi:MAG: chromate efflux transporter [Comamonadaceae bacterium]|nr:MAG: chromate efflux transporter [Comamonadaceae bacterium]